MDPIICLHISRAGYYYCVHGKPIYQLIPCPEGTVFDEAIHLCLPPDQVSANCSETRSPTNMPSGMSSQLTTTATPSQSPATYPTEHPIGEYVLLGPSTSTQTLFGTTSSPTSKIPIEQTNLSPPSQQTPPSLPPSHAPTLQPINPGTSSPTWQHNSNPSNPRPTQPTSSSTQTNPVPSLSPDTKSPSKNLPMSENVQDMSNDIAETEYCPAGFTGVLPWNNCSAYYYCFNSVPHLPTILCSAGKQFDIHSNRCREASEVHCSSSTSTGSEPSHQPRPPTKSPLVQSSGSSQPISSPPSNEENDSPTSLILFDESSSAVDNVSKNTLYSWSSTTNYGSSTVNANTNSSSLPQGYHLGGTFITIEISFGGSSPGDIGWQLLSLDGAVNVAQPTGAYKNMDKNAVIYEGISLQRGSMTRSAAMREFSWTILSVKGNGLGGGRWKLYNGSPIDENLLAVGDDFSYMDTVGIAVNGEGIISLGDKQEQLAASVNTEKEEDDKSMAEIFAQTRDSLDSDESDHIVQSEDSSSRNLKVILISVILAAVLTSVLLFTLAYRKKTIFDDDLTEDFDGWNVEAGTPPAEKGYYEDYYSTDDKQHVRDDMQDSSVSIDPSGSSFNGYEEKPPISNHTQQQLGTVGNNTIANKGTDVSEITTPSVFLEEENQNSNSAIDIENLVASTQANLEHTFDTCIYTILEKLESEVS